MNASDSAVSEVSEAHTNSKSSSHSRTNTKRQSPDPTLLSIIEALRKTRQTEGLAGIRNLLVNSSEDHNFQSLDLSSSSSSNSKRRREEADDPLPPRQSLQNCSSLIAQLSSDIINNRLSSASPSSHSSSYSSDRSYSASPFRTSSRASCRPPHPTRDHRTNRGAPFLDSADPGAETASPSPAEHNFILR